MINSSVIKTLNGTEKNEYDVWRLIKTDEHWRIVFFSEAISWIKNYPKALCLKDVLQAEHHIIDNSLMTLHSCNQKSEAFLRKTKTYLENELKKT